MAFFAAAAAEVGDFDAAVGQEFTDGVSDDVVHDVGGGVIDAAGFFDFGLGFNFGAVAGGEGDDLAEELFVNVAEDVGGQDGKFVRTVGVIEAAENIAQDFIVDVKRRR